MYVWLNLTDHPGVQPSTRGEANSIKHATKEPKRIFFFLISYLSHAWHFSKARGTRPQHPKGFFSFFVLFRTTTTWSQPPAHHHWHGDHSARCHRPHAHTQTHTRTAPAFRQLKRNDSRLREEKGVGKGTECDDLPNRPWVPLVWCYCMSDETWFKRWKLMQQHTVPSSKRVLCYHTSVCLVMTVNIWIGEFWFQVN